MWCLPARTDGSPPDGGASRSACCCGSLDAAALLSSLALSSRTSAPTSALFMYTMLLLSHT